jgi:hypothetical protein
MMSLRLTLWASASAVQTGKPVCHSLAAFLLLELSWANALHGYCGRERKVVQKCASGESISRKFNAGCNIQ